MRFLLLVEKATIHGEQAFAHGLSEPIQFALQLGVLRAALR